MHAYIVSRNDVHCQYAIHVISQAFAVTSTHTLSSAARVRRAVYVQQVLMLPHAGRHILLHAYDEAATCMTSRCPPACLP